MKKSRVEAALQQRLDVLAGKHAGRQSTRGKGTRSQSSGDTLARAQDSLRGKPAQGGCRAGRLESGQSTRGEGTHARRAVDPAETHWQGHRIAAAASLHRAAAGQRDSGRLESGQSTRGEGTRSQSSGSRGDTLARAQNSRCS